MGGVKPQIELRTIPRQQRLDELGNPTAEIETFPNRVVMGMLPPTKGVACRGPMQLIWNGTALEMDEFHQTHRDIILNGVVSPALCRTS
jgi:hypothetical protein